MKLIDNLLLIHPILVIALVFPLIGMVVNFAWQTYQRRRATAKGEKSKIPPLVGRSHLDLGRWLTASVVGVTLIALAYSITSEYAHQGKLNELTFILIACIFVATIVSLFLLYKASTPLWRGVFATLTGIGLVILGGQEGVYRQTEIWYRSHYYYGIAACFLMIFSLTIIPEIYRHQKWRYAHIILNCIAIFFFVGLAITGAVALLEIPLSWQKPHLYKCDFQNLTCPEAFLPQSTLNG